MSRTLAARIAPARVVPVRLGGGAFSTVTLVYVTGATTLSHLTHAIKQDDTKPSYFTQLKGSNGSVQDVTDCGIRFSMRKLGAPTATVSRAAMVVDDADTNTVRYDFADDDTADAGIYQFEVELTGPDGKVMTFPNDSYGILTVTPEIA